jgi:Ribbon-helix-helix protein, copG family
MGLRIELPDDLAHDLEQEAIHRHVSVIEIIREALHTWRVSRDAAENDRERVRQILQDRGLLCQLSTELAAHAQPLTIEELDRLATKAAKAGPLSELIIRERRGEA